MRKLLYLLLLLLAGRCIASIVESTNMICSPSIPGFGSTSEIDWLYTSSSPNPYNLYQIQTIFSVPVIYESEAWNITVILEIYDKAPADGGVLLRQTNFVPEPDIFVGGAFEPLLIDPGDSFFVGLRNVGTITANLLIGGSDVLATYANFQPISEGTYSNVWAGGSCPILLFYGEPVPEPATMMLLGLGAVMLRQKIRRPC